MVGRANGRSMIASTNRLPGNWSRVSTQAITSPKNRLITATAIEIVSVTRKDAIAEFDVTAAQNASHPPPADCHTMAASGSSTMTESHVVATPTRSDVLPYRLLKKPRDGPAPPSPVGRTVSGSRAAVT